MDEVSDLEIFSGKTTADGDFGNNDYKPCGTTEGATPLANKYTVLCSNAEVARFVGLQRKGAGKLTLCEVAVRSKDQGKMSDVLYKIEQNFNKHL